MNKRTKTMERFDSSEDERDYGGGEPEQMIGSREKARRVLDCLCDVLDGTHSNKQVKEVARIVAAQVGVSVPPRLRNL